MTEPKDYGRIQMLANVSHGMSQSAYSRLEMLEIAFSRLPGAERVDLDAIRAEVGQTFATRCPYISSEDRDEVLDDALLRMKGSSSPAR